MEIKEKTITITIDRSKCLECTSKACVKACKFYSRGILELRDGKPSIMHIDHEEVKRRSTECLACEYACRQDGFNKISIDVPIRGYAELLTISKNN